jgi:hypothetical protein
LVDVRLPTRSTAGALSLAGFEADKGSNRMSATFAGSRPDVPRFSLGAAHRVVTARGDRADKQDPDRSLSRRGAESASTSSGRRFSAAGLSFGFGWSTRGWRRTFRLRLFRRCCSNWPRKLGCPPLFDLSFKVPRSIAHNPYSGLAILPLAARLNAPAVQRFSRFRVGSGV